MIRNNINYFNNWLYREWLSINDRSNLTFPYLATPTIEYCSSPIRFLVLNKDTNSWGENEFNNGKIKNIEDLKKVYIQNINDDWNNLGSIWPMYYSLRSLSEGQHPDVDLCGQIGFMHSNVALIGRRYGNYGYDSTIINLLQRACDGLITAADPDILLLGIGFGSKSHTEAPYLRILEKTILGKLKNVIPLTDCPNLFILEFENPNIEVYGCPHPQGLSYQPIINKLEQILKIKLLKEGIIK